MKLVSMYDDVWDGFTPFPEYVFSRKEGDIFRFENTIKLEIELTLTIFEFNKQF
jgi:hypothetical protein